MIKAVVGGVVLAAVAVTTLVMVGIMLSSSDRVDITDLEVGECFDLPVDEGDEQAEDEFETVELIETVDCDDPHTAQVLAVGELNSDRDRPYPSDHTLFGEVDRECVAIPADERFGVVPIIPTESTWNGRGGRYLCLALAYGLTPVTGDHAALAAGLGA